MTFAVYKGEKFLDEGTAEELAKRFGVTPKLLDGGLHRLAISETKEIARLRLDWIEMKKTKLQIMREKKGLTVEELAKK